MEEEDESDAWSGAFAKRLQAAREDTGMSQEAVAEKLGFASRSVTRWENGGADPGSEKLAKMADLYGVSMDWIAGRTTLKHCIKPGAVLLDPEKYRALQILVAGGAKIYDVPERLVRTPGFNCAAVVPDNAEIVSSEAADDIERELKAIWQRLKRAGK